MRYSNTCTFFTFLLKKKYILNQTDLFYLALVYYVVYQYPPVFYFHLFLPSLTTESTSSARDITFKHSSLICWLEKPFPQCLNALTVITADRWRKKVNSLAQPIPPVCWQENLNNFFLQAIELRLQCYLPHSFKNK